MIKNQTLKDLFKRIKIYIDRLEKRQKILISLLIFALLFSLYNNKLFKPWLKQLTYLKSELVELEDQALTLKTEMPLVEKERAALNELKIENNQFKNRLSNLEKKLPKFYRIPQLLGELAKQTSGFEIDFSYIKPQATTALAEEEYERLEIEMQFDAPYYDFLGYLAKLERLSLYLTINQITIEETKEANFGGETTVTIVISTLLPKEPPSFKILTQQQKEKILSSKDTIERNIFVPDSHKIKGYYKYSKYLLSGIAFAGLQSTAIINNEVYKVGDFLDKKWMIKQILPNMVIIKHGSTNEVLTLLEE